MKTAYDLLLEAPDAQMLRLKLAYMYIASGHYLDAAQCLDDAAKETDGDFSCGCAELAAYCYEHLNAERLSLE